MIGESHLHWHPITACLQKYDATQSVCSDTRCYNGPCSEWISFDGQFNIQVCDSEPLHCSFICMVSVGALNKGELSPKSLQHHPGRHRLDRVETVVMERILSNAIMSNHSYLLQHPEEHTHQMVLYPNLPKTSRGRKLERNQILK